MKPGLPISFLAFFLTVSSRSSLAEERLDGKELFVRRVWPLLEEKCLACHGKDDSKIKGEYDLRTSAAAFKGGESGERAILPGNPDASPIFLAITRHHEDWEPMPPKEADKLTPDQVTWIKDWIVGGAPWLDAPARDALAKGFAAKWGAEDGVMVPTVGALSPEWANRRYKPEAMWAYQPVRKPTAPSTHPGQHPIDAFLGAKLPPGATVAPPADPRTLIRRMTFDLLGLPPTPEEVTQFEREVARDRPKAIGELIERLLASPHYGEQWARHWLDVVRYADSSGFANDFERGNTWRYRDYVVRAFNSDKPYDQFVREQIAGDELAADDPDKLVATGFLRMGPWELTGMEVPKIARQRFLDDVTNSVGETFLSHSLQCARCHDHKFDPVPTHDYYAIQACFSTTQLVERPAPFAAVENTAGFEELRHLETLRKGYVAELERLDAQSLNAADGWFETKHKDRALWDQALVEARESLAAGTKSFRAFDGVFDTARELLEKKQKVAPDQFPPWGIGFSPDDFGLQRVAEKGLQRLKWEVERYEPIAFSVYNGRTPARGSVMAPIRMPIDRMEDGEWEEPAILGGGDPFSPTTKVQPGVLTALSSTANLSAEIPAQTDGRRLALAQWIAQAGNPLTTRSLVNRIWLWHFGQALAGNPNNFGSTGKKPTHPELLDWLAASLVEQGWSLKAMHRLILTSAAYQRGAALAEPDKRSREELEKSYAAFRPRRLSSEELRDAMLRSTGELNPVIGGIPNRPEINLEVAMQPRQVMGTFASAWVPNPFPPQRHRRSLYALKLRGVRDPFMEVFNEPGPDFSCEARDVSTVTPQVFSLFNSHASYDRALALAHRALATEPTEAAAIDRVYALAFQRPPSESQRALCLAHWKKMLVRQQGLQFVKSEPPRSIKREAIEENTGEKFTFTEPLPGYAGFVPDLQPGDVDARTRALADVCLVLLNSSEFSYLY